MNDVSPQKFEPALLDGVAQNATSSAPLRLAPLLSAFALIVTDAGIIAMLAVPALWLRAFVPNVDLLLNMVIFAGVVQITIRCAFGLYPGYGTTFEARLRRLALSWLLTTLCVGGATLALTSPSGVVIGMFVIAMCMEVVLRSFLGPAVRAALKTADIWGVPVHVIGKTVQNTAHLRGFLLQNERLGFQSVQGNNSVAKLLWAGPGLPSKAELDMLKRTGKDIVLVADLPKMPMSGLHPAQCRGNFGINIVGTGCAAAYPRFKRLFDLILAIPLLFSAAPIVLVAAICVRFVDPGPIIYTQRREGFGGRQFDVLKLRTMYMNADDMLEKLLASNPEARAEWETHFKLRRDPRILPLVGSFLRKSSMDELPQLWNVIRGDMSLVGPRPFPVYHLSAMSHDFRARRSTVVPGLTGIWQISDRSNADLATQEALDGFYIDGRSHWGDTSILLQTFAALIRQKGAY